MNKILKWFSNPKPAPVKKAVKSVAPLRKPGTVQALKPVGASSPAGSQVISTIGEFPPHSEMLSGVESSTFGLRVPPPLQDFIVAVRLSATSACIAYDPTQSEKIKPHLTAFRLALGEKGLSIGQPIYVTSEVLQSIRLSAQDRSETRGSGIGGTSDGVRMFREWVTAAKELGSTDLHMRIMDGGRGEVTIRVDGEVEAVPGSDHGIFTDRAVAQAMKSAYENLADKHSNNDGTFSDSKSMSCMIDGHLGIANLRLRFNSQRGFFGPKAVVRLLPSEITAEPMSFQKMGFSSDQIDMLEKAQRFETGMVLQMGVTGSGKTTVAKTFMEGHPRNGKIAMYQIGDPIEYLLRNVHQIYVQRDLITLTETGKKDPYAEVIESITRMDPDLVDLGEVRDAISARALANVAKTGHLALGTLHADSLMGAINRLTDPLLGLSRHELTAGNLLAFVSYQALVPVLCEECAIDDSSEILRSLGDSVEGRYLGRLLGKLETKLNLPRETFRFRNPIGCSACRNRGTRGLTIVAEMMMPEEPWLDLAAEGKDREAMRWWRNAHSDKDYASANTSGKLVIEHTIYKAIKGIVDPRNIERFGQLDALEVL